MSGLTFQPRALLVAAPLVLMLWAATDLHWGIAFATAVVVYDVLSFAGACGACRR